MENPKPVFVGRGNVYPSSLQSLESTGKTATKLNGIFADRFIRLALFRTFEIQVEDPAKATGTAEEKWKVFQRVRDQIEERIKQFAAEGK